MIQPWVKDIVESTCGRSQFAIGKIAYEVMTGRKVKITDGQYWGEHGVSNFWYWQPVKGVKEKYHGYGYDLTMTAPPYVLTINGFDFVKGQSFTQIRKVMPDGTFEICGPESYQKLPRLRWRA